MAASLSVDERAAVVSRLRAAGCVFAEDEAALLVEAATSNDELDALLARRVSGEPLEPLLGWAEFCGLQVVVVPGVFVPRRRTEYLVDLAVITLRPGDHVLDLCCGCGAIGLAIASRVAGIVLEAAELDPVAAECARRNLGETTVYVGDLFAAIPAKHRGSYDVIVANVPYVPTGDIAGMPREARDHEPRTALDGGSDGLDILRRVTTEAPDWLAPDGLLFIETSEAQANAAATAFRANGLKPDVHRNVELGATVVVGGLTPA